MKIRRETPDATAEDKETFRKHRFAYCVCTAGDSIGLTIENLNDTISQNASLQALGITEVSASYSLIMPESYVGLPFMDVDPKEREVRKKSKSAQELAVICEEIFDRKEGVNRLVKVLFPGSSPRLWADSLRRCSSPTSGFMWRKTSA